MNTKKILYIIGSLVGLFLFLLVVYQFVATPVDYKDITSIKQGDHVTWSPAKKHILVVYTDLQCPACKAFHELMKEFESSTSANRVIPEKVTLVIRHFPLYQIHENAFDLSYAAEAATAQDKFFSFIDAIFKQQDKLEKTKDAKGFLMEEAKKVGIDTDKLVKDMNTQIVKDKVNADLTQGEKANIQGTPTFFLDGKQLEFQTPKEFIEILKKL